MAFVNDGTAGIDLALAEDTVGAWPLLTMKPASDGNIYQRVRANGALSVGSWVKVNDDGDATPVTTTITGTEPTAIGVSQIAASDNQYLWVVRGGGTFTGLTEDTVAANAKVYTTGTAGTVDDDASGTDLIQGVTVITARTGAGTTDFFAAGLMVANGQD